MHNPSPRTSKNLFPRSRSLVRIPSRTATEPAVPMPTASAYEVREFVISVIPANSVTLSQQEAEQIASHCEPSGRGLFVLEKNTMKQHWGLFGEIVFDMVHRRRYGYVS